MVQTRRNFRPAGRFALLASMLLFIALLAGSPALMSQTPSVPEQGGPGPAPSAATPAAETPAAPGNGAPSSTGSAEGGESGKPQKETIWVFLKKGGPTMIGLGIISTFIVAFALERAFFFRRQKINTKGYYERVTGALDRGGLDELEKEIQNDDLLLSRILRNGLRYRHEGLDRVEKAIETMASVEIGKLEKGLNFLNNLGNLAPLLGFFGTVTGMRNSFLQFVEKAAPTARDLAGGVEEALITTIAGLLIAIPAYFVYNLFIYYIDSITIELERNTAAILEKLK